MTFDFQPGTRQEHDTRRKRAAQDHPTLSKRNQRLIDDLTECLLYLQVAKNPKQSVPFDKERSTRRPSSEADEGAATRWARRLESRIHERVNPLLSEFDARLDGRWTPRPPPERVRCMFRKCGAYGKRIPKFVGPAGEIELVRCPECDRKLYTG